MKLKTKKIMNQNASTPKFLVDLGVFFLSHNLKEEQNLDSKNDLKEFLKSKNFMYFLDLKHVNFNATLKIFNFLFLNKNDNNDEKFKESGDDNKILGNDFYISKPRMECEIMLSHFLKCDRSTIHANSIQVSTKIIKKYLIALKKRKSAMPLEYITNTARFYGYIFYVDKNVLIPRSDSEILVDNAIDLIQKYNIFHCIEIGTGSGALIISIMKALLDSYNDKNIRFDLNKSKQDFSAIAVDISKKALKIAQKNAKNLDIANITFLHSNMLSNVKIEHRNTLLITNPPYISLHYNLNKEVRYEPKLALYGGEKGYEILQKIIKQFVKIQNLKFLVCEIGYDQHSIVKELLQMHDLDFRFYKDNNDFFRGFIAIKNCNF